MQRLAAEPIQRFSRMRVLVTGASGYLGLHILRRLAESGHAVTALVRTPSKLGPWADHPNVTVRQADLEDHVDVQTALRGQEACIHAALIWGEPGTELELRDAAASARLFDAAGHAGLSRVLYVSSTAAHRPFGDWMAEGDRLAPTDMYGATKAASELFLWAACAAHDMVGIVVRAGPVVGPPAFPTGAFRSPSRLEQFVRAARRGAPLEVEQGAGRQFVGVTDLADVLHRLVASRRSDGTYLCIDRDITTWESLARRVVAQTESASPVVVRAPSSEAPPPRFDHRKLLTHLGLTLDSSPAMQAHVAHLAAS